MDIYKLLDDDTIGLDRDKVHVYKSLIDTKLIQDNITTVNIDPVNANRYKGNLFGLLKNELDIPNSAIYINMLVNDCDSSLMYDGSLNIKILNADIAESILDYIDEHETLLASL